MNHEFYIYKLIDPKTSLPFYIGKGKGGRIRHHEKYRNSSYFSNPYLKNKINKILIENGFIRYQQRYIKDEKTAFLLEIALITKYGRKDNKTGILCNMSDGGEGVSGHIRGEEWKDKHRKIQSLKAKKIDQYSIKGKFIKTWDTYKEIVKEMNIDPGSLSKAINGKLISCAGYRWSWNGIKLKSIPKKERKINKNNWKKVYKFDINGNFIAEYENGIEAAKSIDRHANSIYECCNKKRKHVRKYIFSYK